ncbi:site-specific DNA-methyltransferase [Prescottella subtropica]|uniref:site-specific DNA-methyltransferase n=1 Tax=Prescottella subtropica TaxID=2545757 RepID=UPI0010F499BF|nr:site-specific DNA-methyltransferase [Prescottella subtropica]
MARNSKSTGPTPVDAIQHQDKRTNIPTADAHDFVDHSSQKLEPVRYQRDPSLDPQLVWRGKDQQDADDLVVDAPPIYIQEKIDPRVLVENLRRTAERPEDEPELSLFDEFDGLDELSQIEFYEHQANWSNRMILGDSLQAMTSLAERERLRGQVQMVYLDPPYGIKFGSNWQASARKRDVKDGKLEDAAREAEQIKAFRDTWELGIHSYLPYLRDRLIVARDLLTESGSCFVQIGDENVHLVRSLMDEVFGSENFVSQIVFTKTGGFSSAALDGVYDLILWYARDTKKLKYHQLHDPKIYGGQGTSGYTAVELADGTIRSMTAAEKKAGRVDGGRILDGTPLISTGVTKEGSFEVEFEGRTHRPPSNSHWKTTPHGVENLRHAGRLVRLGNTLEYKRYLDDFPYISFTNVWLGLGERGFSGKPIYVVQTDSTAIERCMLMCTDPGDLVVDPTCGSGTTAFVAEQWGRRWITMDTSRVALALARQRLMGAKFPYYLMADSTEGRAKEAALSGKPAAPNQSAGHDIRYGFVYERVQHVTLKSISNNPDIVEGMSREEIDAAIKRHADFEYLYDRPYEDKKKVRVTGPFTVESLSPHRSISFPGDVAEEDRDTISTAKAATDPENPDFERSILDNLAKAGIQNGKRNERITFAFVESYAGEYVQAVGERPGGDSTASGRVALAIGPQYGTVDPQFVKNAAREAIRDSSVDLLCILGFSFDPQATGVTEDDGITVAASDESFANVAGERKLGRIPVLMVRMNSDLLMGEDLKKTGAGNLFTVFGEPDIELHTTDTGDIVVDLLGVDVYDPTTGEVRSNDTGRIALWMIDTNYNEESFFVRHCYFTGGNDPYKRLKTALRADIDADSWSSLYSTTSRPFVKPDTGKIAVKVINDYGDEVMKVFEV